MSLNFGFSLPALLKYGIGGFDPFNQSGPTLDLVFAGTASEMLSGGYTLNTNFIVPQYEVAAQYSVWENGVGMAPKTFSDIVTFTRASSATYFDSAGVLQTAGNNVPRFDYNPSTLAARGLLIEEARTNSIRNNTMQGAVAGTPGTVPTNWTMTTTGGVVTRTIVGIGTESGITYIEVRYQFSGAGSANILPEPTTQVAATTGQTWTASAYVKLIAGGYTNLTTNIDVNENDAGGTFLNGSSASYAATTAGLATQRVSLTRALNQATTAFVATNFRLVATGAADITLRIGLPQLEQGAFATSVIPTTTTALTRNADVASVNTLSPWYNATEGTLFAEITASANANTVYAALNNGTITQNSTYFDNDTGSIRAVTFASGSAVAVLGLGAIGTAGTVNRLASAYKGNDFAAVRNGGTVQTDTSGAVPVSVSQLDLGRNPSGLAVTYISGYLRRITYYPRRMPNAQLQTITT